MQSWIPESPETSAKAICEALVMAVECSKARRRRFLGSVERNSKEFRHILDHPGVKSDHIEVV